MTDVFISYATEDRERVRPLVEAFEARGWSVWWDREIQPGSSFQRVITDAIAAARCVVVCWTEASIDSDWVASEADEGKSRGVLVPLLLDDVRPPLGFRMDHAADLRGWRPDAGHPEFDTLLAAIGTTLGASPATPAAPEPPVRSNRHRHLLVVGFVVSLVAVIALVFPDRVTVPPGRQIQATVGELLTRPSVAVLPFTSGRMADDRQHLALGMMHELIVSLREMRAFPVSSANAALVFTESAAPVAEIADALGASYVVQGNLVEAADGLRVVATLSDADGNQVWADRFERQTAVRDLLGVVDELAAHVAAAVRDSEIRRVRRSDRPPADAWEHYLFALEALVDWRPEKYESAMVHAQRAIEIAPDMAEAWWAYAELQVFEYMETFHDPATAHAELEPIIASFRRAHELSPFHASACGCLGFLLTVVGREDEAKAVYEVAMEVNPLAADLMVDYAPHLLWTGNLDGAREVAELALRLDPISADRANAWMALATVQLIDGDPEGARQSIHRGLFIQRNPWGSPAAVPMLYLLGDVEGARRELEIQVTEMPALDPRNPLTYMSLKPIDALLQRRRAQGVTGLPEDVVSIFEELGWTGPNVP